MVNLKTLSLVFTICIVLFSSSYIPNQQASAAGTLTKEIVLPSDNQISLQSIHVIEFTTATTGTIKTITITYPAGFNLAAEHLIQAAGIGAGTLAVSGQTLTYTVNSAASVPSGTGITIMAGGIVNAGTTGSKTVSVTTNDPSNFAIDGPTTSTAFTLTGVTGAMINNNAVTSAKIVNGAVTNTKIPNGSINSTQIKDGTIVNADISTTAAMALSKLAAGALPSGIMVNSANIVDSSITGADIAPGVALTGSVSIDSPTLAVDSVNHRLGVGTTTPAAKLDVNGDIKGSNNILWNGGKSVLSGDQGGSIDLGDGLTPGAIPYIDFHYGKGISQAFNMRLINNADGLLSIYGGVLSVNGSVYVGAASNPGPEANSLYIKNDQGDGFDTLRLDGSFNNLYMIAKSAPGAATGAGIVFRTAPAGGGELDRMSIDSAGNVNINAGGKLVCAGCVGGADLAGNETTKGVIIQKQVTVKAFDSLNVNIIPSQSGKTFSGHIDLEIFGPAPSEIGIDCGAGGQLVSTFIPGPINVVDKDFACEFLDIYIPNQNSTPETHDLRGVVQYVETSNVSTLN